MKNKIRNVSEKILKLELELQNREEMNRDKMDMLMNQMEEIADTLSPEEMIEVDEYIQKVMRKCQS